MYKVLRQIGGRLFSFAVNNAKLEYKTGEWIYPEIENSKLFVFEELLDATRFVELHDIWDDGYICYQIWECSVVNPKPAVDDILSACLATHVNLLHYWGKNRNPFVLYPPPKGTMLVDSLCIEKLVRSFYGHPF